MRNKFSAIADGMVWLTLPLMGGLYYWEYTLRLLPFGHKLMQILLLLVVFGWAYFWNTQAEYESLRRLINNKTGRGKMRYRLVTASCFEEFPISIGPATSDGSETVIKKDEAIVAVEAHTMQYPLEMTWL